MGSLETFFLLFLLPFVSASDYCPISKCSNDKVLVRFPFRLQGLQSKYCGYPGFDLSCSNQGKTVLKLPNSGEFLVRNINYLTQQIQLYDSLNCIPKQLLSFNLSDSPFVASVPHNYTFLRCPTQLVESRLATIDCLSNSTTSVLAIATRSVADSLSTSCEIINTLPIPVSWPVQHDAGFSSELRDDIQLTWDSPACAECEERGGICGLDSSNTLHIGCFSSRKGKSSNALQILKVICLSIAVPSLILSAGIVAVAFLIDRNPRRNRRGANQNSATATVAPDEPNIEMVGLDESTIETFEKVVLGDSLRIPAGPNHNTCAICLGEYRSKETLRCIPECNHCFHAECIDEWLKMNNSCPVCRKSPSPSPVRDGSSNV